MTIFIMLYAIVHITIGVFASRSRYTQIAQWNADAEPAWKRPSRPGSPDWHYSDCKALKNKDNDYCNCLYHQDRLKELENWDAENHLEQSYARAYWMPITWPIELYLVYVRGGTKNIVDRKWIAKMEKELEQ